MGDGVVLVGNGGHARACVDAWSLDPALVLRGYLGPEAGDVLHLTYLGDDDTLDALIGSGADQVFVALGDNRVRARVSGRCTAAGAVLVTSIAPSAQVAVTASVGPGSIVMHRAFLGAKVRVGTGTIINTGASVDHDGLVGDHVHIAPGATIAGTVTIGDGAMVGAGATIVPGIVVGESAVVGAGAVVIRDVPAGTTVVGVPAQELNR